MKKLTIFSLLLILLSASFAQDFKADIATAKTAYAGGKLADAHFALEQAMQEIDMIVGQEVLKLLPVKIDTLNSNPKEDHVMANSGFIGATIHRSYGLHGGTEIEIISNSPMLAGLNAFLNMPVLGGMMRDENTKVVKVQGYKSRLEKQGENENGKTNYSLQIPFSSALLTLTVKGKSESEVLTLANSIPMEQIAKLIQ
ncbi:MAG: hypothetical protein ABI921_07615 [Panacibacter sp.]